MAGKVACPEYVHYCVCVCMCIHIRVCVCAVGGYFGAVGVSVCIFGRVFLSVDFQVLVCEEVVWCVTWWEGRMWLEGAPVKDRGGRKGEAYWEAGVLIQGRDGTGQD